MPCRKSSNSFTDLSSVLCTGASRGMEGASRGMGGASRGMGGASRGMGGASRGMGGASRGMGGASGGMGGASRGMGGASRGMGGASRGMGEASGGMRGAHTCVHSCTYKQTCFQQLHEVSTCTCPKLAVFVMYSTLLSMAGNCTHCHCLYTYTVVFMRLTQNRPVHRSVEAHCKQCGVCIK